MLCGVVWPETLVVGRKGVMKIGDGSNVPRVACHGAHEEAMRVVDEVENDHIYQLSRELGDWGRTFSGRIWGTSTEQPEEQPLDFGFGSIPKFVKK